MRFLVDASGVELGQKVVLGPYCERVRARNHLSDGGISERGEVEEQFDRSPLNRLKVLEGGYVKRLRNVGRSEGRPQLHRVNVLRGFGVGFESYSSALRRGRHRAVMIRNYVSLPKCLRGLRHFEDSFDFVGEL